MIHPTNLPNRRSLLKGVTLGAGGILFAPLLQKIAAAAEGKVTTPKRVIFLVFDNGSYKHQTRARRVGEPIRRLFEG